MDTGYILLSRKLLDSKVFHNEKWLKVWTWCLLKANHKKKEVPIRTGKGSTVVTVERGQFIFGRESAAKELNISPSTIRNIMQTLLRHRNIDIEKASHYSLITIRNYKTYQDPDNYKRTGKRTGKGQPKDNQRTQPIMNKNEKNNSLFEDIWKRYPNKDGKKDALKHFKATVKGNGDWDKINLALDNYLAHLQVETWKKPKNGSTWFNNWEDWVEVKVEKPKRYY